MNFLEPVFIGFDQIRRHKLRTTLSILGILISVGSVTGIVSMGDGLSLTVTREFEQMGGANLVRIRTPRPWVRQGNVWIRRDWETYLTNDDIDSIEKEIDHIKYTVPVINRSHDVRYRNATTYAQIIATNEYYHLTQNWDMEKGRFINEFDINNASKVAVLGPQLAKDLYGDDNPIGKEVKISNMRFLVVGILKAKKFFDDVNERNLVIPYTTAQKRVSGNDRLGSIFVYVDGPEYANDVAERIRLLYRRTRQHGEDYRITTGEDDISSFNNVVRILKIVAGGIAGISLLVGGIGIMNIMLVSVTERTREIGIRKALGAKRRNILMQFIMESMVLCLFGGFLGVLLGLGIGTVISAIVKSVTQMPFESIVTPGLMIFAILYSAFIGLFFGVYPAWRASRLDPIVALRYE